MKAKRVREPTPKKETRKTRNECENDTNASALEKDAKSEMRAKGYTNTNAEEAGRTQNEGKKGDKDQRRRRKPPGTA